MKGRCGIRARAEGRMRRTFIADSAVIAYRTPAEAQTTWSRCIRKLRPTMGRLTRRRLMDDSLNTAVNIAAPKDGGPAWLEYEFDQPFTARALSLGCRGRIPVGKILASDDGVHFRTIADCPDRRDTTERRFGRLRFRR